MTAATRVRRAQRIEVGVTELVLLAMIWIILFGICADYIHNDTLRVTAQRCRTDGQFKVDRHLYTCRELP